MGLRRLLGMRPRERRRVTLDIDEMIAAGEFDRAEGQLRTKVLANPNSLGYRVKLADLLARSKKPALAANEYMAVAEAHAGNEAYDPAIRLVQKALHLSPGNLDMTTRLVELERLRLAISKRGVIFERLEHGERPAGSGSRLSSSRMLKLWPGIAHSAFVQALSAEILGALFSAVEPIRMNHHTAVMRQGQIISRGHLIAGGEIEATTPAADGRQIRLQVLEPGEFFGEASLLDNAECPANYRAIGDGTTVLRLNRRALDAILENDLDARDLTEAIRRFGCDDKVFSLAQKAVGHRLPSDS